uniref:Uncharacterized protein n=1 Tax=Arundo donax TaxID=35708 RepID=A0A0A9DFD1_ARUDO
MLATIIISQTSALAPDSAETMDSVYIFFTGPERSQEPTQAVMKVCSGGGQRYLISDVSASSTKPPRFSNLNLSCKEFACKEMPDCQ